MSSFLYDLKGNIEQIANHLTDCCDDLQEVLDSDSLDDIEELLWGVKARLDDKAGRVYELLRSIGCERKHNESE